MKMKTREWAVISLVLGFFAFAAITAKFSEFHAKKILLNVPPIKTISISLTGAVQYPGQYECPPGTSLQELLKKAGIKPSANRRKIPFKKNLLSNQEIHIPEKQVVKKKG